MRTALPRGAEFPILLGNPGIRNTPTECRVKPISLLPFLPVFILFLRGDGFEQERDWGTCRFYASTMFTFYLSQVGVSTFTTSKAVLDEMCACVCLLLGSPGADLGSEEARTGGQGSQGQKPSLHPGPFLSSLKRSYLWKVVREEKVMDRTKLSNGSLEATLYCFLSPHCVNVDYLFYLFLS